MSQNSKTWLRRESNPGLQITCLSSHILGQCNNVTGSWFQSQIDSRAFIFRYTSHFHSKPFICAGAAAATAAVEDADDDDDGQEHLAEDEHLAVNDLVDKLVLSHQNNSSDSDGDSSKSDVAGPSTSTATKKLV
jgi:hypothetical protein